MAIKKNYSGSSQNILDRSMLLIGIRRAMNFYRRPIRLYIRAEESNWKTPDRKRATGGLAIKKSQEKKQYTKDLFCTYPHDRYGYRFSGREPIALILLVARTKAFCARAGHVLVFLLYSISAKSNETIKDPLQDCSVLNFTLFPSLE